MIVRPLNVKKLKSEGIMDVKSNPLYFDMASMSLYPINNKEKLVIRDEIKAIPMADGHFITEKEKIETMEREEKSKPNYGLIGAALGLGYFLLKR